MNNEKDRVSDTIVKKIEEFERAGNFFEDVENDPPSRVLMPDEIDYYRSSVIQKMTSVTMLSAGIFTSRSPIKSI